MLKVKGSNPGFAVFFGDFDRAKIAGSSAYDVIQEETKTSYSLIHMLLKITDECNTNKIKEHLCEVPTLKK